MALSGQVGREGKVGAAITMKKKGRHLREEGEKGGIGGHHAGTLRGKARSKREGEKNEGVLLS